MKRFIVISHHTEADCARALKEVTAMGYLTHFDWGCKDGAHTGWAILEADDRGEALMSVPTFLRNQATVIQLTRFEPEMIEEMHKG